jgi:uncharacterized damage-inducible protein DinB
MMNHFAVLCFLVAGAAEIHAQGDPGRLTPEAKAAWGEVSSTIVKAAEKMPEDGFAFRPAPSVRTFGELIGHVTDAGYLFCSALATQKKAGSDAEHKLHSKSELVNALKESVAYCNTAFEQVADPAAAVKLFGGERASLTVMYVTVAHAMEHYGNIVTYLRLKGIVPPSSEPRQAAAASERLYFDRAHGELPPPGAMGEVDRKLNLTMAVEQKPISPEALSGVRLLYLRAPSKTFADPEKKAITNFVRAGGSLLLVLDEEKRQNLAVTGVNDLISPFGMRLTPDTPYVPNPGAIALAGEINRADRELPYDGGRAVEGGTPFAFQLDAEGHPAQPYASWRKVDGGGKIVVMAEGMASLFLGSPNGRRLAPVNDNSMDGYFGKDSAVFMEEVLSWLIR